MNPLPDPEAGSSEAPVATSRADAITDAEILSALDGPVPKVRLNPSYAIGTFLVACGMILLPLIYIALVAVAGFAVYYHATENLWILSGSGTRLRVVAYFAPLLIGSIVVFFMIKPLFARQPKRPEPLRLRKEDQDLLFAFVRELCGLVGAPVPKEIVVDCDVNASASFRRGVLSMFSHDLVLTIGLPLVSSLNLRQLTGILAHEFGHFAQGSGMRLTYVIRSINAWFARVVFERDRFDDWLERQFENAGILGSIVFGLARGIVGLIRGVLRVLMNVGHFFSCFMLRQMEFDADRYAARVVGSGVFAETVGRLPVLAVAGGVAQEDADTAWRDRKLPANFPDLVRRRSEDLDEETREEIRAGASDHSTDWNDTHPSDRDRVASVQQESAEGLFCIEPPASAIFRDYPELAEEATVAFYRGILGEQFRSGQLLSNDQVIASHSTRAEEFAALHRHYQGTLSFDHLPLLGPVEIAAEGATEAIIAELRELREALLTADDDTRPGLGGRRLRLALSLVRPESPTAPPQALEAIHDRLRFVDDLQPMVTEALEMNGSFQKLDDAVAKAARDGQDEIVAANLLHWSGKIEAQYVSMMGTLDGILYPFDSEGSALSCAGFAVPHTPEEGDLGEIMSVASELGRCVFDLYFRGLAQLSLIAEHTEVEFGLVPLPRPEPEAVQVPKDRMPVT